MIKKILLGFLLLGLLTFFVNSSIIAQTSDCQDKKDQEKITCLQNKINDLQGQKRTLSSQIAVMDNQVRLTEARIEATKQEISELALDINTATKKIDNLEKALDNLTKVLINRIVATYEVGRTQPFEILLSSTNASNFFSRFNYLKIVQSHDKQIIYQTQQAKSDYTNQKDIFEAKKKRAELLKASLDRFTAQLAQEKKNKQTLLTVTQNDENRYQTLLAQARAEFEAIQGIIAGRGIETEVGVASEGQKIATLISGPSCNSSGTHLHFIASRNGGTENPFNHLRGGIDYENCSGQSCGSGDGDSFNPSGSWSWPLDPKIIMTQGYGSTWATHNDPIIRQIYSFHNGIDIKGSSLDVKAVKSGTLYQGSYGVGCLLRYVRVRHDDGLDTLYLHINYIL